MQLWEILSEINKVIICDCVISKRLQKLFLSRLEVAKYIHYLKAYQDSKNIFVLKNTLSLFETTYFNEY